MHPSTLYQRIVRLGWPVALALSLRPASPSLVGRVSRLLRAGGQCLAGVREKPRSNSGLEESGMRNDKETQKVRVKNAVVKLQRDAPPETAGADIEKCVNDAFDFFGNRVVSDSDILEICFLMILRVIEPLADEDLKTLKAAWDLHPEIKTLLELKEKVFGYVETPKSSLETGSPKSSTGLGIMTPDPLCKMLGAGYMRFASPFGIRGVARESANRVDFVVVVLDQEDKNHFRAFIRHCQAAYHTICVWEVWNDAIIAGLRRYGFQQALKTEQFDKVFRGWRWDRGELTN